MHLEWFERYGRGNVSHFTEWSVRDLFWAQPGLSGTARGKMSFGYVSVGCACPKLMGRLRQQIETWGPKIQS